MKLILTDYIASLKEEKELDALIEQLLQQSGFEIVFGPKKGERQYGVDIYAVGPDWEDGGRKKVFLVTVKQGNLDRKNWEGSAQALQPSLQNIASVFIRNNIAPEHLGLPIKIIIAHNGTNDAAIQQNWRGLADLYPQYEFLIWQLETLVNLVSQKLINENLFSDEAKRALRKIVIHLSDPDYDLAEYVFLMDEIIGKINLSDSNKRHILNQLRKINLLLVIVISYCEKENDLRLALKASEITLLRMYKLIVMEEQVVDEDQVGELMRLFMTRKTLFAKYLAKILPACLVKNGLSRQSRDAVSYTFVAYEQLGFIAVAGLENLQFADLMVSQKEIAATLVMDANECANGIIQLFNNNSLIFTPRADDQIIEISLAFLLLMKLGRDKDVEDLLILYNNEIAQGKMYSNIAPHFQNDIEEIFELDIDYEKRKHFDYQSSCLLTILTEWCLAVNKPEIYTYYYAIKKRLFDNVDLILWLPDADTEKYLYTEYAGRKSGYSLSGIELPEDFASFKQITLEEYLHNSAELKFSCFGLNNPFWAMPAIASRHYRTYLFPHYWRMWITNRSPVSHQET